MQQLEMYFTKASLHNDGSMHWAATVSDTQPDNHGERVDRAFFLNAIENAESFGMPHLCISHYDFMGKDVPEEIWKAGLTSAMFLDGEKFKAKGLFSGNKAGRALFGAVRKDMEDNVPHDERTRISMGFYDRTKEEEKSEATEDGDERRVYKAGIIKHFAGTRVPVLPRTEIEAWREKSMTTKKEDAESIVGGEHAEELEEYAQQVGKSETESEGLVVKADEEETVEMAKKKKKRAKGQPEKVDKDYEYTEQPRGEGGTMAEEMWTETGEEATYETQDTEAKKKNERERQRIRKQSKKKSETEEQVEEKSEEELTEQMIKDEDGEVVLYSKDGSKVLGRFPYGPGKKYKDKSAARAAAHKREGQIQFFKRQKSEAEEEKCDVVGGTDFEEEGEVVEEAELTEMAKKGEEPAWKKAWVPPHQKGWTQASVKKFWESLGGSITSCATKMEGHVKNPINYCSTLKRAVVGPVYGPRKKKSETEEFVEITWDDIGATEEWLSAHYEEQSEVVEKFGRRLKGKKVEEFRAMRDQLEQIIQTADAFLEWAEETPEAITGTTTGIDMPPENPAIAILEQGTPAAPVYAADFDDQLCEFAETVYENLGAGNTQGIQDALNKFAEAITMELKSSTPDDVSKAEEEEVNVKAEEVESPEMTPLDAFNMKSQAILNSDGLDRRGKLAALQDAVNETATWLQKSVIEGTPPSMGDIREVIVASVEKGTQPLLQELATLKAEIEELRREADKTGPPQAPVRKSVYGSQGVQEPVKEKFSAAEVARMTTPQGVYY